MKKIWGFLKTSASVAWEVILLFALTLVLLVTYPFIWLGFKLGILKPVKRPKNKRMYGDW